VSPAEALARLGEAAGDAFVAALGALGGDDVELGAVTAAEEAGSVFDGFDLPVQAASVAGPGVVRTTFVLTQSGAARLAAATAAEGQAADIGAVGAMLGSLSTAAATAVAVQVGAMPEALQPPLTRLVAEADPDEAWEAGATVVVVSLTVCGEPAALVMAVPAELLDRVGEAAVVGSDTDAASDACGPEGAIAGEALREVKVRLWAELGRTRMALGRAVGLSPGEVVELDAAVDDPVIIFVNGVRLGSGHLVVGDDGEWAFRVLEVSTVSTVHRQLQGALAPTNATVEGKEA
jgi:flagellar motor switch protein FliN/FliY